MYSKAWKGGFMQEKVTSSLSENMKLFEEKLRLDKSFDFITDDILINY